jgi:transcriptional regulator with XRE-family HTH domain
VKADLTTGEQANVRTALKFLRTRCGTWAALAAALGFTEPTLSEVANRRASVSARMAFRVARFAGVGVDEVLTGRFPEEGTCPHCGHRPEPQEPS